MLSYNGSLKKIEEWIIIQLVKNFEEPWSENIVLEAVSYKRFQTKRSKKHKTQEKILGGRQNLKDH